MKKVSVCKGLRGVVSIRHNRAGPSPKWSSVKKWLLHINYAPGYAPEPEQKPVCRQFSRCEGCPYPAHGFLCWGGEDDCMRTRVKKLNEKELEHEDQSGFV